MTLKLFIRYLLTKEVSPTFLNEIVSAEAQRLSYALALANKLRQTIK